MREPDVGDDAELRAGDVAQERDVAGKRSPISATTPRTPRGRVQQRDGSPNSLLNDSGLAYAERRRERGREQILGRRLARRARDADDAQIVARRAHRPRDRLQPRDHVRHLDERRRPRCAPSTGTCAIDERDACARVGTRPRRSRARRDDPSAQRSTSPATSARESNAHELDRASSGRPRRPRHPRVSRSPRGQSHRRLQAPRATSTGRRTGRRRPPTIWPGSWPLPAMTTTSPRSRPRRSRCRIAARRSSSTIGGRSASDARPARRRRSRRDPRTAGCRRSRIRTIGEPRRGRAHQRALGAVAVAAAAVHDGNRAAAPASGRAADEHALERVGRVRVVDEDRGTTGPSSTGSNRPGTWIGACSPATTASERAGHPRAPSPRPASMLATLKSAEERRRLDARGRAVATRHERERGCSRRAARRHAQ